MESLTAAEPINGRARSIVIFSDGTGQRGGVYFDEARTSVYKLFRATRVEANTNIDPARQLAFWPPLAICHPGRETTSVSRRLRNVDGEAVPELSPASAKIHRRAHQASKCQSSASVSLPPDPGPLTVELAILYLIAFETAAIWRLERRFRQAIQRLSGDANSVGQRAKSNWFFHKPSGSHFRSVRIRFLMRNFSACGDKCSSQIGGSEEPFKHFHRSLHYVGSPFCKKKPTVSGGALSFWGWLLVRCQAKESNPAIPSQVWCEPTVV
jgi:hypothetical protein